MNPLDLFHRHLDACRTCREQPMALCPIGESLLRTAGSAAEDAIFESLKFAPAEGTRL